MAKDKNTTTADRLASPEFRAQISKALPDNVTPEFFVRIAATAMSRNPALSQCTQASFFRSLLDCGAAGLWPDGKKAHLVPYNDKKTGTKVCTLQISYIGMIDLALRSGMVSNVYAEVVRENDDFSYEQGLERKLNHLPKLRLKDRGKEIGAYAVVYLANGLRDFDFMDVDEVNAIRDRSPASSTGPWLTDYPEMVKKTVIKRLMKRQPQSAEYRNAMAAEDLAFEEMPHSERADVAKQVVEDPFADFASEPEPEAKPEIKGKEAKDDSGK